ncbi:MAG TPA: sulfite exporter TauE/SafE family protein [Anaerolineales bacterium]
MLSGIDLLLIALAAVGAGAVNALAGGGTLITFPTLTFIGVPAVASNVTNTVALLPGYIGGTIAQSKDIQGQEKRLWYLIPAGLVGGAIGGFLLLHTGEKLFRGLIPWLILAASVLLAIQDPVKAWLTKRMSEGAAGVTHEKWSALPVGLAAIYGGYFGAGLSVIILAALGLTFDDSLTRLNAIKQLISFSANLAAAIFFVFSGQVVWIAALVMAVGALIGGVLGGRLAGRVPPATLRWIVVVIGVIVSIIYFVRG